MRLQVSIALYHKPNQFKEGKHCLRALRAQNADSLDLSWFTMAVNGNIFTPFLSLLLVHPSVQQLSSLPTAEPWKSLVSFLVLECLKKEQEEVVLLVDRYRPLLDCSHQPYSKIIQMTANSLKDGSPKSTKSDHSWIKLSISRTTN